MYKRDNEKDYVVIVNENTRSLWRAKNSTEYCDNKGRAFVEEKLQKEFGWVCINQIN